MTDLPSTHHPRLRQRRKMLRRFATMHPVFVYIVEAPSPADIFDDRTEGSALSESLKIAGRPHALRTAVNIDQFRRALALDPTEGGVGAEMERRNGAYPLLHFSMHGNSDGIVLTSGEFLLWADLIREILPLNEVVPAGLHIGMSSCHGFSAASEKMHSGQKPPYAVLGTPELLPWSDGLIAFSTFYHHWFKGDTSIEETLTAVRLASGHSGFELAGWKEEG